MRENPLKYFWPHQINCDGKNCRETHITFETYDGKQHTIRGCPQFSFLNSQKDITAYFGANRSGKTTAGAVKTGYLTTGQYPDWYRGKRWERATIGRIFTQDFSKGAKIIAKKLKEWLPRDSILHVERNNQRAEVGWHVKHTGGGVSYFDLFTYEQDVDLAEGWDGDWAWFDEPPPRDMYIATARGLIDADGIIFFTLTPLKEPWLFDEIYNSKDGNIDSFISDMRHNLERINPLTNKFIGLKEQAIRKFEQKLTEEERETRAHGRFRYLAGRIWKEWERDVHTFDRTFWVEGVGGVVVDGQPPIHWPRIQLIDPHDRNPHALLWIACDETDNYWAYREGWMADTIIPDAVELIKQWELDARERIQIRIMDPNFGPKPYANTGLSVRDEFEQAAKVRNYPMRFSFGDDRKEVGRKEVAKLLKFDPTRPLSLLNHPRLRIAKDLNNCVYQVEHYVWDEYRSNVQRDPKERPKDLNTHFPDLLHYFALSKFGWRRPSIKEGRGNPYG